MSDVRPVDLRDYVQFDEGAATRIRVHETAALAQDLWCIEPQQATDVLRYDDHDVVYTVLGGRSWFVTDQGEIGLDPLASMLVPRGVVHGIDNRGVDPLIVAAAVGPPAQEGLGTPAAGESAAIRDDTVTGPSTLREAFGRLLRRDER